MRIQATSSWVGLLVFISFAHAATGAERNTKAKQPARSRGTVSIIPAPSPVPVQTEPAAGDEEASADTPYDTAVKELNNAREQLAKVYNAINANNPFSNGTPVSPADASAVAPEQAESVNRLQGLLGQPAVKSYLNLFSNPAFSDSVTYIIKHPSWMMLLYIQAGWIIFNLFFRAWRYARADRWYKRIWVGGYTFVIFWIGAIVVIPAVVFGTQYVTLLSGVAQAAFK